jgi:hypothetical protein
MKQSVSSSRFNEFNNKMPPEIYPGGIGNPECKRRKISVAFNMITSHFVNITKIKRKNCEWGLILLGIIKNIAIHTLM